MTTHRKMRDPAFRLDQWERRFDPHAAPINHLVDILRQEGNGRMPYVAPLYGGTASEVLFIFQDPGPGTDDSAAGSGFLCSENDDPSAQLFAECLESAGLDVRRVITWNAYPWALPTGQRSPKASQLDAGVEPLRRLLGLLPNLKVVVTMGRIAQNGWSRTIRRDLTIADNYLVLSGLHTSGRGITDGGQHSRLEGIEMVKRLMQKALDVIGYEHKPV